MLVCSGPHKWDDVIFLSSPAYHHPSLHASAQESSGKAPCDNPRILQSKHEASHTLLSAPELFRLQRFRRLRIGINNNNKLHLELLIMPQT